MKKIILMSVSFWMLIDIAMGQRTISGSVYDKETKEPLYGVSIVVPSQNTGVVTNSNGGFAIETDADSLYISYVGYISQKIRVAEGLVQVALEESTATLNEIIVSANREQQERTEAPIAIHAISKLTLNETKATRLDLLLNKTPGVFMVDLGNEQHSMSVRQPVSYKSLFLYLEDGVPIRTTGDFNHNALIEINYAALNRIEIIKGPASSLYGSEAVGGAINFITQQPSLLPTAKVSAEKGSYGYLRSDFFVSNSFNKLGLYAGGYYANRNQPDSLHNDFHKLALNLRADYAISGKTKLVTTAALIDYQTDQVGGLDSAHFYSKNYTSMQRFTYRKVNAFRVKSSLQHDWGQDIHTSLTAMYRTSTIGQNPFYRIKPVMGDPLKARGEINEDAFKGFVSILQHSHKFAFLGSQLIAGLSTDISPATYYSQFISIDKSADGIFEAYTLTDSLLTEYEVSLVNTAEYVQWEAYPFRQLKLVAAIRYDRLDYKFDNHLPSSAFTGAPDEKNHFEHWTPKLGLTYDFKKDRGIYLNYSTGFAPPNISELYAGVKVPTLKPAIYKNYEGGGWYAFAKKGYVEMNIYQMLGANEIVNVKLADGSYLNQNVGKTLHQGVEANIRYQVFEGLMVRAGGTLAKHEYIEYIEKGNDYSGNSMSQAPRYLSNSEITYRPAFLPGFRMGLEWQTMGRYFMDAQNTKEYEGFSVFNARAGYKRDKIEMWLNCINLTDAVYATTSDKSAYGVSYRPGQLRTFNVGIGYSLGKGN